MYNDSTQGHFLSALMICYRCLWNEGDEWYDVCEYSGWMKLESGHWINDWHASNDYNPGFFCIYCLCEHIFRCDERQKRDLMTEIKKANPIREDTDFR